MHPRYLLQFYERQHGKDAVKELYMVLACFSIDKSKEELFNALMEIDIGQEFKNDLLNYITDLPIVIEEVLIGPYCEGLGSLNSIIKIIDDHEEIAQHYDEYYKVFKYEYRKKGDQNRPEEIFYRTDILYNYKNWIFIYKLIKAGAEIDWSEKHPYLQCRYRKLMVGA